MRDSILRQFCWLLGKGLVSLIPPPAGVLFLGERDAALPEKTDMGSKSVTDTSLF